MKKSSLLSSLCIGVLLTGCGVGLKGPEYYRFKTGKNFSNEKFGLTKPNIPYFESEYFEQNEEINNQGSTLIDITNKENQQITINKGGKYVLTGKSTNTSILVTTDEDIKIILDNVNITSIGGTPIEIKKAKSASFYVKPKTKNYICDSQTNDKNAAIYAECPLSIEGKGFLYLNSYGQNRRTIVDYGKCIYTTGDLSVKDTRIIVQLSTGSAFEVLGNAKLENTKIEVKFSCGGGINVKGDLDINDSLFIYTGAMNGIYSNNFNSINSEYYIYTVGQYTKIDPSIDSIDENGIYYSKEDKDYMRVNPLHYDKTKTLYTLSTSTKGILSNGKSNFVNCKFYLDTDDDSIASLSDIESTNSHYFIKSSNQGVVSDGTLTFSNIPENEEFPIKIYESFIALKGDSIYFDGASTYVDSLQSGLETSDENGTINFKNNSKLIVDTDVFALLTDGEIDINNSFIGVFGGDNHDTNLFKDPYKVNINESTVVLAQNHTKDEVQYEGRKQNTISVNLGNKVKKNDVVHVKSKNRKFFSSIIVPKAYENLMITISSNLLNKDEYQVSKGGFIDYKFVQDLSLLQDTPIDDELLLDLAIKEDNSFVYDESI